jgi:hypothetical protein
VTPLDAPSAVGTPTDGDIERAHDGPNVRQIFLVLCRMPRRRQAAAAIGAASRQRRRVTFIDLPRDRSMRFPTIGDTCFATRPAWSATGCATRERRGLPVECAARLIQVVFEPLDLFAQTVAFLAIPIPLASQLLVLALLPFEFFDELFARCAPARHHAPVMP